MALVDMWSALEKVLHPQAASDMRTLIDLGEIDPKDEQQMMDAAIGAQSKYTDLKLTFSF